MHAFLMNVRLRFEKLRTDSQADRQINSHKLLIYVQIPIEMYRTHGCCSKKQEQHEK